jgi:hypothetical protein
MIYCKKQNEGKSIGTNGSERLTSGGKLKKLICMPSREIPLKTDLQKHPLKIFPTGDPC